MRPSSGVTFNMILISTGGIDLQNGDLNREVLFTQRFENRSVSGHSQASSTENKAENVAARCFHSS